MSSSHTGNTTPSTGSTIPARAQSKKRKSRLPSPSGGSPSEEEQPSKKKRKKKPVQSQGTARSQTLTTSTSAPPQTSVVSTSSPPPGNGRPAAVTPPSEEQQKAERGSRPKLNRGDVCKPEYARKVWNGSAYVSCTLEQFWSSYPQVDGEPDMHMAAGFNQMFGAGGHKYDVVAVDKVLDQAVIHRIIAGRTLHTTYSFRPYGAISGSEAGTKPLFALSVGLPGALIEESLEGFQWARKAPKKKRCRYLMVPDSELDKYGKNIDAKLKPLNIHLIGWSTQPPTYGFAASRNACLAFSKLHHPKADACIIVDTGVISDGYLSDGYNSDNAGASYKTRNGGKLISYAVGHGKAIPVAMNAKRWKPTPPAQISKGKTDWGSLPRNSRASARPALEQCTVVGVAWRFRDWAVTSSEDVAWTMEALNNAGTPSIGAASMKPPTTAAPPSTRKKKPKADGEAKAKKPKDNWGQMISKREVGTPTASDYKNAYAAYVKQLAAAEGDIKVRYSAYGSKESEKDQSKTARYVVELTLKELAAALGRWNDFWDFDTLQSRIVEKILLKAGALSWGVDVSRDTDPGGIATPGLINESSVQPVAAASSSSSSYHQDSAASSIPPQSSYQPTQDTLDEEMYQTDADEAIMPTSFSSSSGPASRHRMADDSDDDDEDEYDEADEYGMDAEDEDVIDEDYDEETGSDVDHERMEVGDGSSSSATSQQ